MYRKRYRGFESRPFRSEYQRFVCTERFSTSVTVRLTGLILSSFVLQNDSRKKTLFPVDCGAWSVRACCSDFPLRICVSLFTVPITKNSAGDESISDISRSKISVACFSAARRAQSTALPFDVLGLVIFLCVIERVLSYKDLCQVKQSHLQKAWCQCY